MIGLSVSFCVTDIVHGVQSIDNVDYICAGTRCSSQRKFAKVCRDYSKRYWTKNPSAARAVARRLWREGKIVQPRLRNLPAPNIAKGHWVEKIEDAELEYKILDTLRTLRKAQRKNNENH